MRLAFVSICVMCAVIVTAGSAHAKVQPQINQPYRGECRRLTKQMSNLNWAVEEARRRDNEIWERATAVQIYRMAERRERLCPGWGDEARLARARAQFMKFMKMAGEAALRYFTFGAY